MDGKPDIVKARPRPLRSACRRLGVGCLALATSLYSTGAIGRELTDMTGRTVEVPEHITKVVALGGALRFVTYLQALDLVAGVENIERTWQSPGRLYGLATAGRAADLPVIGEGGPGRLPDFEKLVALWPDVIVTMGISAAEVRTIQQKTGIPVFALHYGPTGVLDLDSTRRAIQLLGQLLDRQPRAEELLAYFNVLTSDLKQRTAGVPAGETPSVYVGGISFKGAQGITSTAAPYAPLAWVGADSVACDLGPPGHYFIDPEKLLVWDPAIIFLDAGSFGRVATDYARKQGFYQKLRAFREGRVFLVLPYNYYHTNIEIALADAYFIGKILYPQRFADIEPAAKADAIFRFFIGQSAYRQLSEEYHGFVRLEAGTDALTPAAQ
jgi:iron complex transport system substrate-binding protein